MGNRCVITTKENFKNNGIGIYLHWNCGRDSVEGFLEYCKLHDFRAPEKDNYGWARLCQVICNFCGKNGLGVGIDLINNLDCNNGDNGVYIIENWKIVDRKYFNSREQDFHKLKNMLYAIDDEQPQKMQIKNKLELFSDTNVKTITEYCPYCEHEQRIQSIGSDCSECGHWLKPCSICYDDNTNCEKCKYNKETKYVKCIIKWVDNNSEQEVVIKTNDEIIEKEDDSIFFYGLSLNNIQECVKNKSICENEWQILEILEIY